jgi:hypothetical protein
MSEMLGGLSLDRAGHVNLRPTHTTCYPPIEVHNLTCISYKYILLKSSRHTFIDLYPSDTEQIN